MSRRRPLRPEEEELWKAVARSARPLHPVNPFHPRHDTPTTPATDPNSPPHPRLPSFRLGEKARNIAAHDLAPSLGHALAEQPLRMDAKAFSRMTKGRLAPEARIDLHGMTLAEAHPALIRFILSVQGEGLRLVLVITGKGKPREDAGPIPQRMGALRHQVPQWLRQPPLGLAVQQVAEAHLKHGGSGACYVYLRRR